MFKWLLRRLFGVDEAVKAINLPPVQYQRGPSTLRSSYTSPNRANIGRDVEIDDGILPLALALSLSDSRQSDYSSYTAPSSDSVSSCDSGGSSGGDGGGCGGGD